MRYLSWIVKLLLVFLLMGFALKNTEIVTLRNYLDYEWRAPLVLILLVFFVAGAAVGLLAGLATVYRQRREILALKRAATLHEAEVESRSPIASDLL